MRIVLLLLACGGLAACGGGAVTVPSESVIMEVPHTGSASTTGGDSFTSTIEASLAEPGPAVAPSADGTGAALNDDRINLMQWTLEQQKIDAAIAERDLAEARSQLVVVQPGPLPNRVDGVNVAPYAKQSTNALGQSVYPRSVGARVAGVGNCGRFRDPDSAQRAFLSGGGPERDRYGIDPDGDGFACSFDPAIYRALN
jgi:hypothetical protein